MEQKSTKAVQCLGLLRMQPVSEAIWEIVRTLLHAAADFTTKAETCLDAYDNLILSHVNTLFKLPKNYRGRRLEPRFQYASASTTAVERGFCEIVQFFRKGRSSWSRMG
jgi:hypothetical protein